MDHVTDSQFGQLGIDLQAEWILVILKELEKRELGPRGLTPSYGQLLIASSLHMDTYYEEGEVSPGKSSFTVCWLVNMVDLGCICSTL